MNSDFICVTEIVGNHTRPTVINTRFIRTVVAVDPKGGQCPHYNAGARTYLLMEYNTMDESITYVREDFMQIVRTLNPLGLP